jgi:tetratricopeptide (TPR) repeat protein
MQFLTDLFHQFDLASWSSQYKDAATLGFGFSAFVVSAWTFMQKKSEAKGALRKQLTEIIEKLHDLNVENAKANDENLRKQYPKNFGRLISDQRRFLVRQAKYIAEQIPKLVSPYELMVIAIGLEEIDDAPEAEKWFRKAVSKVSNQFDEVIVRRQFGRALFRSGQVDEARKQFQLASEVLKGTSDREIIYNGDTFERWAGLETDYGSSVKASDLLQRAELEYEKIGAEWLRKRQLDRLKLTNAPMIAAISGKKET